MSLYTEAELLALEKRVTSFRAQEGYLSFYKESEYIYAGFPRADMTLVGQYLFYLGLDIDEQHVLLTPKQAYGKRTKNLKPVGYQEYKMGINGLYTQESSDLTWLQPGHDPLIVFIDYIDDSGIAIGANNAVDATGRIIQTIVVRDARLTSKRLAYQDAQSVSFNLSFTGGLVAKLPNDGSEYGGDPLPGGGTGGSGTGSSGFGYNFGADFGS